QPNNCEDLMPISRARADTFVPGSKLRATISALNSSDHRRRRATGAPSIRSGTASIRWKLLSAGIVADIERDTHLKISGANTAKKPPSPDGARYSLTVHWRFQWQAQLPFFLMSTTSASPSK